MVKYAKYINYRTFTGLLTQDLLLTLIARIAKYHKSLKNDGTDRQQQGTFFKKKNLKYQSSKKTKNFENADFPGQSGYNQGILKQTE